LNGWLAMGDPASVRDELCAEMHARFGIPPRQVRIVRAPYRICPLGAHIDHQLGRVTAMAIDQAVHLAFAPAESAEVRLASRSFPGEVRFRLDQIPTRSPGDWGNYPRGAALALARRQALDRGLVGVTSGALAEGGLSSSASVGLAYLVALAAANGRHLSPLELIRLDQEIENGYLGLNNGILDQAAIVASRPNHLTVIDCLAWHQRQGGPAALESDSLEAAGLRVDPPAPRLPRFAILAAFSGISQAILNTGYNLRVSECVEAARSLLAAAGRAVENPRLGHVTAAEYQAHRDRLTGIPARRAAHFFGEMDRVRAGLRAWRQGDLEAFGRLMAQSGHSSIDLYQCGSPPLIDLFHILLEAPGVYGARFSGAGFRGCCVALVDPGQAGAAILSIRQRYAARHPELASRAFVLQCAPDDGLRWLEGG
jgi:galacturonokinase